MRHVCWFLPIFAALALGQSSPPRPNPGTGGAPLEQRGIHVSSAALVRERGAAAVPRGYALIIGVQTYPKLGPENNQLRFPERDAEAMFDVLISQEGGNFHPQNVRKLIGPQATLANVRAELEAWLPSVAREGDRVLIYFAGHAFLKNGQGYLAPYDTDLSRLDQTAYPMAQFSKVVGSIRAGWKVLFTDACHSGAITPETSNESVNRAFASLGYDFLTFNASRQRESSFEDPQLGGGHGLFTYFLIQGMQGQADQDHDGVVTADELIDYVRSHVREHARQRSAQQNPTESGPFDPDLILAFHPKQAADEKGRTLAEGELVVDANKDGVEFLLDGKSQGIVNREKPLSLPGIAPGPHTIVGVKSGYDSDGPREVMVYPSTRTPVNLRIQYAKPQQKKSAIEFFERGVKAYNRGGEKDCREAIQLFEKALQEDDQYGKAALYLGRTYQVVMDDKSALQYLQRAVQLDPADAEARVSYGAALLDRGDTDEAIRQLREGLRLAPRDGQAHSHLAKAYRMAEEYDKSIAEAKQAIDLSPASAQAHLWLGDSLRAKKDYTGAKSAYVQFLYLSDMDAKFYEKLGFYLFSTPFSNAFAKKRSTQRQVYRDQRNLGYFGLCECEWKLGNLNRAVQACQKALGYDQQDPYSYYRLGRIQVDWYNQNSSRQSLLAAQGYFQKMLSINDQLDESAYARKYLQNINQLLQSLPK